MSVPWELVAGVRTERRAAQNQKKTVPEILPTSTEQYHKQLHWLHRRINVRQTVTISPRASLPSNSLLESYPTIMSPSTEAAPPGPPVTQVEVSSFGLPHVATPQ
jgi:hypothetical protein